MSLRGHEFGRSGGLLALDGSRLIVPEPLRTAPGALLPLGARHVSGLAPRPYPAWNASAGMQYPGALGGRSFSTRCTSSNARFSNAFHFGQFFRAKPFACSLSPRSHEWYDSAT